MPEVSTPPSPAHVPMLDLAPEVEALWDGLAAAFERVMRSGQFVGGPEVAAFEAEAAAYLGVRHAVAVNSGTDALAIALRALGVGPGDEVVTTPFSFFATAEAIANVGAAPVFVDVDERTYNIDPALIEPAVTSRTKAVLPVHLFGRPVDMDAVMDVAERHGLKVVEDCAQSFGAAWGGRKTGAIGDAGAFSFYPTKNLGGFGDGGLVATDDDEVAATARMLRDHGSRRRYHNVMLGYNSRLDALHAAMLRVKLPFVDEWNERRREAARRYDELLRDVPGLVTPELVDEHVFHQYTVRVLGGRRDEVRDRLAAAGVATLVYYPVPQDRLPVFAHLGGRCPASDRLAHEVLSLPMGPFLDPAAQASVAGALEGACR
ncbi:MAG TPA: DegT/DnrJ/EryC1/StrS family aminotransferase [Trueperaceae bacterium]